MAQPVLAACGLQGVDALPPLTLLKQHSGVDGSFLIASILGHRLKSSRDNHVLLVATQHTYHHYSSACMKLSFNLGPGRDSGQLQVLDVAAELYRSYPLSCSPSLDDVTNRIRAFLEAHPKATILMDDLTYFLNFGYSEAELIDFVEQLVTPSASFVVKVNTAELYGTLCANLDDLARTEIRLERLASGQFREVDGRLSVSRFQAGESAEQALMEVKKVEKSVLYKVNERNIKVFVPGEVGIKNV
ncbi:elongator complex protein 6 [Ochlerotatus camptorhynchus]|uniref:elongator complex protein 6 n=1 Tax=Ochlerotatus camptorhynchus TaxID=644619 RepID=UPI0031CEE72B